MVEMRNAYKILIGELEGKGPRGRPRSRWEDNIRIDISETVFGVVDWILLPQDRDQ
jgi:hypothetical protein